MYQENDECQENREICEGPAVIAVPKKNRLKEFLLDPSTNQLSMSRLCMGIVVIVFMPVYFLFAYWHIAVPASIIVSSLASLATVYGLNSAFGAYNRYRGIDRMAREIERPLDTMTGANKLPTMRAGSGSSTSPTTGKPIIENESGG